MVFINLLEVLNRTQLESGFGPWREGGSRRQNTGGDAVVGMGLGAHAGAGDQGSIDGCLGLPLRQASHPAGERERASTHAHWLHSQPTQDEGKGALETCRETGERQRMGEEAGQPMMAGQEAAKGQSGFGPCLS